MEGEEEQQRKWMRAAPIPMSSAFSFLFFSFLFFSSAKERDGL
jgi:hypothetical protein